MRLRLDWSLLPAMLRVLPLLLFFVAKPISAQTSSLGAITGVVTDPTNAVVPDATVTIKDWAGRELVKKILDSSQFTLLGAISRSAAGQDIGTFLGLKPVGVTVSKSLSDALSQPMDVVVDYTSPGSVKERTLAETGLKLYPGSQPVQVEVALAYAISGDTQRARTMADELNKRYPLDTQVHSLWLPAINAQLALNQKQSAEAIEQLQRALPPIQYSERCLYHTYIRGQAYLAAGQGKEAAAEFQKILDDSGLVSNCWTGALARLGVARANALQAQNSTGADADLARTRSLAAYKDFLTLWKDADPDIPIYKQAKAEYAKLQ